LSGERTANTIIKNPILVCGLCIEKQIASICWNKKNFKYGTHAISFWLFPLLLVFWYI